MQRRCAFTLVELILVVLVLSAITAGLVIACARSSAIDRRAVCMNNVRAIGVAMRKYADSVGHSAEYLPLVDANGNEIWTKSHTNSLPTLPSRTGFAALFKHAFLASDRVLICPSSDDRVSGRFPAKPAAAPIQDLVPAEGNCSYGWDPSKYSCSATSPTCAIVADKPPLGVSRANEGTAKNNSPNHQGRGQHVYFHNGGVMWRDTPDSFSGDADIYTGAPGYEHTSTDAKIVR